jgi:hypothetical protein
MYYSTYVEYRRRVLPASYAYQQIIAMVVVVGWTTASSYQQPNKRKEKEIKRKVHRQTRKTARVQKGMSLVHS